MNPDTRTGWDLVAAAQAGDVDAFAELYRRYKPNVAHYIASCVRHRQTTEDLTSETFLRAWRSIRTVRDQGYDVSKWLIHIARNIVIDHFKSAAVKRSTRFADIDVADYLPRTVGPEVTVPAQRAAEDAADRLELLVAALPPKQQTAIRLRFNLELSHAEAGRLMGCHEVAVRNNQRRALHSLARAARPARTVAEFTDGLAS
jgi:RNA polymerase sigma-70 factor (ECF subfamily)